MDNAERERLKSHLRGWVAEYLDEGNCKEFLEDLRSLLSEERDSFKKKASYYQKVLETLQEK